MQGARHDSGVRLAKAGRVRHVAELQELRVNEHEAAYFGAPLAMRPQERSLLCLLVEARGRHRSVDALEYGIWGNTVGARNRVSNLVASTKQRLLPTHMNISELECFERLMWGYRLVRQDGTPFRLAFRHRVLVADSDPCITSECCETLGRSGFEIDVAGQASDVAVLARTRLYDVVVSDLEWVEQIVAARAEARIFVVTADCSVSTRDRIEARGWTYCAKPLSATVLRLVVRGLLE